MPGTDQARGQKRNNFGFLRLLFAALVIVSHAPEMTDGNRHRELLTMLFGTMSLGEVAVDGFFLVSGYLITKSFARQPEALPYLARRVLRIYPGYLACFWICVLLVAPTVGAGSLAWSLRPIAHNLRECLLLQLPDVAGAFQGLPQPYLDGAMWTIAYEFRCYLAVLLLGSLMRRLGARATRAGCMVLLAAVVAGLLVNATGLLHGAGMVQAKLFGYPEHDVRFLSLFGTGALFYLLRDRIRPTHAGAALAALGLASCLASPHAAEAGVAVFGGYLVFWCAFACPVLRVSRLDDKADISFGLYLYAWPIQNLIVWYDRAIDPWLLCLLTLGAAGAAGYASWHLVERPASALLRARRPVLAPAPG